MANQIAAGEVVERPASVVKELLENAIDAHSQRIEIDIERGGSSLIRISDNGEGIGKDDLALAVSRHATSKVHTLYELEHVNSLGFRGEALASISAVSKLSIQSKPTDQKQAWMINTGTDTNFANYQAEPEILAHPEGTTIEVRDLFFNTPARRKFMRTIKTEFKHIDDIVKRIALSQFDIAFKLTHNKKIVRNLPKAVTEKAVAQRISKLFSPEFLSHANKVDFTSNEFSQVGQIRLWGWISQAQWHRNQPDWQYFYVNGRFIRDKLVNHALRQAYQDLLPADTYAAYLLYLEISPEQVDVNVHPTKHEVRFRQTRLVHDFIFSALNQVLGTAPLFDSYSNTPPDCSLEPNSKSEQYVNRYSQQYNVQQMHGQNRVQPYQTSAPHLSNKQEVSEHLDGLKQLYQIEKEPLKKELSNRGSIASDVLGKPLAYPEHRYLLSQKLSSEEGKETFIIDIHRAHQYLLKLLIKVSERTPLLIPQSCSLSANSLEKLLRFRTTFNDWGLELDQLSEDSLVVRALPSVKGVPGCRLDVEKLIQILSTSVSEESPLDFEQFLEALVNSISVVELKPLEQEQLLALLSQQIELHGSQSLIQVSGKDVWRKLDDSGLEQLFNQ